jgi:hypothetical protein
MVVPLADHVLIEALPFFAPVLVIGLLLAFLVLRDRRRTRDDR